MPPPSAALPHCTVARGDHLVRPDLHAGDDHAADWRWQRPEGYSWHLSVVDASHPRNVASGDNVAQTQTANSVYFNPCMERRGYEPIGVDAGRRQRGADQDDPLRHGRLPGHRRLGRQRLTKVGVFIDGLWFLDLNGNGVGTRATCGAKLGQKGDQPVTGDWDGDGKTDIGIFGPAWIGDEKPVGGRAGPARRPEPADQGPPPNVPPDPPDAAVGIAPEEGQRGRMRSDVIDHVFHYGSRGRHRRGRRLERRRRLHHRRLPQRHLVPRHGRRRPLGPRRRGGPSSARTATSPWSATGPATASSKLGVYRNGTFYLTPTTTTSSTPRAKVIELGARATSPWSATGGTATASTRSASITTAPLPRCRCPRGGSTRDRTPSALCRW